MQDYREILKNKLEERAALNPRYSLRAFARDLGIAPSRVSNILRGKQGLSLLSASKIGDRLGMNAPERDRFCGLVLASDARSKRLRERAAENLAKSARAADADHVLRDDQLKILSEWYHLAILELTRVKGFKSDTFWIAARLLISEFEAHRAVERLERHGLLAKKSGRWKATNQFLTTSVDIPSETIRNYNRQLLRLANEAIELQTVEERDFSSIVVAIDDRDLPEFKKLIRDFRRGVNALAEKTAQPNQVYVLANQFFKLTKGKG